MKKASSKLRYWLQLSILLVPIAYLVNFCYAVATKESGGTFGDTFGAANALFSGLALMMLVYAVILQRDELEVIKEDRDTTRNLLAGQETLNSLQKQALDIQTFDQSFNSLLQTALDEKTRLLVRPVVDGRVYDSRLRDAGANIRYVLRQKSQGVLDSSQIQIYEESLNESIFLLNLIIHLTTMIDQSCPQEKAKLALRKLIASIIDSDLACCFVWLVIQKKRQGDKRDDLESFLDSFGIMTLLQEQEKTGFENFMDDYPRKL